MTMKVIYILLAIAASSLLDSASAFFLSGNTNNPFFSNSLLLPPPLPQPVSNRHIRLLILPGFGNDSNDYTMPGSLVDSLTERGWSNDQIAVLPVTRTDWLQVFWKGVVDVKFWTGQADPTRGAFSWYLERISQQIESLIMRTSKDDDDDDEAGGVILIGHSAGGWLGRAALGFGSSSSNLSSIVTPSGPPINLDHVLGLVSLGAPHLPPPPGVMDMTRGALRITNEFFPGAYHKPNDGLFYITAIGLSVRGEQQQRSSPLEPTSVTGFAYSSYEAVCGDGTVLGDGVVPYCAAHLDDALQLDLEGVLHSINAPDNWYGSSSVIDQWHDPMLQELQKSLKRKKGNGDQRQGQEVNTIMDAFANGMGIFKR
jgi:hypothetical protein